MQTLFVCFLLLGCAFGMSPVHHSRMFDTQADQLHQLANKKMADEPEKRSPVHHFKPDNFDSFGGQDKRSPPIHKFSPQSFDQWKGAKRTPVNKFKLQSFDDWKGEKRNIMQKFQPQSFDEWRNGEKRSPVHHFSPDSFEGFKDGKKRRFGGTHFGNADPDHRKLVYQWSGEQAQE